MVIFNSVTLPIWTKLLWHLSYMMVRHTIVVGQKKFGLQVQLTGLDNHQCTAQLTVFADVKPVQPTVIFQGQGKRTSKAERDGWDSRVRVMFQEKAWCDEAIMREWVASEWANVFTNPHRALSTGKILVADVHATQQTNKAVKTVLHNHNTELVDVTPGCTSRIRPLDVSINKPNLIYRGNKAST